jgi:membrane protein YdbS with pleckstrin-like domain
VNTGGTERAAVWIYSGVWGVLARWFRVPHEPPTLPVRQGAFVESFKPAPEFLRYLKFFFWIAMLPPDIAVFAGWAVLFMFVPWLAMILLPVAIFWAIAPDLVAYVALHLRYDTTWYVMSDRSLRIRRGIWIIEETTITFENVQNVRITQGPLQRYFGISTLVVDTAGGGGGERKGQATTGHSGVIEGITDAERWRDLILARLRASRSAGLGDHHDDRTQHGVRWSAAHLAVLREIRDTVVTQRSRKVQP